MFFNYKDKASIASMITKGEMSGRYSPAVRQGLENLRKCVSYCLNESDCRRVLLLEYFGELFASEDCHKTCDNCRLDHLALEIIDYTEHAMKLLMIVNEVQNLKKSSITISKLVKLYSKSKEKELEKYEEILRGVNPNTCSTPVPHRDTLERIIQNMVIMDYLDEQSVANAKGFSSDYLIPGSKFRDLLDGRGRLRLSVRKKCASDAPKAPKTATSKVANAIMMNSALIENDESGDVEWIRPDATPVAKKVSSRSRKTVKPVKSTFHDLSMDEDAAQVNHSGHFFSDDSKEIFSPDVRKPSGSSKAPSVLVKRPVQVKSAALSSKDVQVIDDSDDEHDPDLDLVPRRKTSQKKAPIPRASKQAQKPFADFELAEKTSQSSSTCADDGFTSFPPHHPLLSKAKAKLFKEWLEQFRQQWSNYWNHLSNATVQDIVLKVPLSIEELTAVSGMGESKARNSGEKILATIYVFLEKHDLLHLFPKARSPTLTPCPTWSDPFSTEAQEIRVKMLAQPATRKSLGGGSYQPTLSQMSPPKERSTFFQPLDPHSAKNRVNMKPIVEVSDLSSQQESRPLSSTNAAVSAPFLAHTFGSEDVNLLNSSNGVMPLSSYLQTNSRFGGIDSDKSVVPGNLRHFVGDEEENSAKNQSFKRPRLENTKKPFLQFSYATDNHDSHSTENHPFNFI